MEVITRLRGSSARVCASLTSRPSSIYLSLFVEDVLLLRIFSTPYVCLGARNEVGIFFLLPGTLALEG